jgi:hypothetical protein
MADIKADGAAGARRASAILGIAACAETTAGSFAEDAAKVDVRFSFRNAFAPKNLITLHAQIKSGKSYKAASSTSETITLQNIDSDTINALTGLQVPGLLIWVPPKPLDRIYWYASHPRTRPNSPLKLDTHQYVRPSIRYDLSRLSIHSSYSSRNPNLTVATPSESLIMNRAKLAYKSLKSANWEHPLVGNLIISRLAWRHVTRRSKTKKQRNLRLLATPYLRAFLDKPPDRFVRDQDRVIKGARRTVDIRYILCWYRSVLTISGEAYSLLLRIRERISYPNSWLEQPLSVDDVEQEATLVSWWCKRLVTRPPRGSALTPSRTG